MKVSLKILFDSLLPLLEIDSFSSDHVTALYMFTFSKQRATNVTKHMSLCFVFPSILEVIGD